MNSPTQESEPANPAHPATQRDTANRLARGLIIIAGIAWALSSIFEGLVLLRGKLLFTSGGGVLVGAYNTFLFGFAALYPGISNVSEPTRTQEFLGADYSGIGIDAPYWPVTIIAAGLVAYALTAAFRAGAKLERDVDGLV